jgi:ABC-type bacteriocin/lantibiotic exporter with double-glycine peptidase domain
VAEGINGPFKKPLRFELTSPGSVAVTGQSGSGKSTLMRLLLGHLKPVSGRILLIDDYGNDLDFELHQANVLVISQDLRMFGDHLRDVLDPSSEFSDAELEKAASELNLTKILDQLPLRWLTPINEFSRDLSLGQLQLFKLSKALLKRYSIIISDEPTCHLPENLHLQALNVLNSNCDLHVSVLHRSSGLEVFDQVLTLSNEGEASLIKRNPK